MINDVKENKVKSISVCVHWSVKSSKLTKFDLCIFNGLWQTKLNVTAKRKLLTPDRRTDSFRQFIGSTSQKLILYFSESSWKFCGAIRLEQDESFQNWLAIQNGHEWAVADVKYIKKILKINVKSIQYVTFFFPLFLLIGKFVLIYNAAHSVIFQLKIWHVIMSMTDNSYLLSYSNLSYHQFLLE